MSLIKKDVWDSYNLSCSVDDEGGVYPKVVLVSRLVALKKELIIELKKTIAKTVTDTTIGGNYANGVQYAINELDLVFPDEVLK